MPSKTRSSTITVSGVAQPGQTVTIRVDGAEAAVATASRTGGYTAQVTLPEPENGKSYELQAVVIKEDGTETVTTASVLYHEEALELLEFKMFYRNKEYDIKKLSGKRPVITWTSSTSMTFRVRFSNNSQVEKVQILSRKGSEERVLSCEYDAQQDCFVASGFRGYVPGVIQVQYLEKDVNFLENSGLEDLGTYTIGSKTGHESRITREDGVVFHYLEELETGAAAPTGEGYAQAVSNGELCYVAQEPVAYEHNGGCFMVQELYTPQQDGTWQVVRRGIGLYAGMSAPQASVAVMAAKGLIPEGYEDVVEATRQMLDFLTDDKRDSDRNNGPSEDAVAREAIREYVKQAGR